MPTKISKIKLCGYKTLKQLDFDFEQVNVLIGPNGAGKSNFISFFRTLSWMLASPGNLQLYISENGAASSFIFDGGVASQITAEIELVGANERINEYSFRLSHAAGDIFIFVEEKYRYSNLSLTRERANWNYCGVGHQEAKILKKSDEGDSTAKFIVNNLQRCIVYQFHNTSRSSRIRQKWDINDDRYLKEDGANLAPVLRRLKREKGVYYRRIVDTIRLVLPFFADFFFSEDSPSILLQWRENGSDLIFGSHQVSDGALRIMALFTLLQMPESELPSVIILDEPELGLHPYAINVFVELLRKVANYAQVILATQSPYILNYFEPEETVVVDRNNRETTFKRLTSDELEEWRERYTMAELWEKNVIGGTPR